MAEGGQFQTEGEEGFNSLRKNLMDKITSSSSSTNRNESMMMIQDDEVPFDQSDEEEEIEFEDITEEEAIKRGLKLEDFKEGEALIVRTKASLKVQKKATNDVIKASSSLPAFRIEVPIESSRTEYSLNERFQEIQSKSLKNDLNPFFKTINFLKRKREEGFDLIAAQKEKISKSSSSNNNPIGSKINSIQSESMTEDLIGYWREHLDFWLQQYSWKSNDDGPIISREELDKELDEYMAKRSSLFDLSQGFDSMNLDMEEFLARKGISKESKEELDQDLDDYMKKKKNHPMNEEEKKEEPMKKKPIQEVKKEDLDSELDSYKAMKGSSKFPTVNTPVSQSTSSFANYRPRLTAQSSVRQRMKEQQPIKNQEDLDSDLDLWRQRQEEKARQKKQTAEKVEREKNEAMKRIQKEINLFGSNQNEGKEEEEINLGDKFADEDFDTELTFDEEDNEGMEGIIGAQNNSLAPKIKKGRKKNDGKDLEEEDLVWE